MHAVTIVRKLPTKTHPLGTVEQILVFAKNAYYVVSSTDVLYSGPETLVFPADGAGIVTEYAEVAGGRNMSPLDAIFRLGEVLAD